METTDQVGATAVVDVDLRADSAVGVVTFSRGRHNYFNYELLEKIASTLDDLRDRGSRAVVLRTTNKHFCAGADFVGDGPTGPGQPHIYDIVPRLFRQPLPIVAAVGGAAIGGGLGLALLADFRVTTPSAYFLANFNRIGMTQGFALSLTLPRLLGPQRAAELFYTARRVPGEEAVAIGLADRLAEPDTLDDEAFALAAEIAKSAPLAVASTRRTLRADLVEKVEETLRHERSQQDPLKVTEDFREGVQAWREKRVPRFRGA